MSRPVMHALTQTTIPNAVCEDPTGDGTHRLRDVTCSDCQHQIEVCRDRDPRTGRICDRGAGHPGEHLDEPNGDGW